MLSPRFWTSLKLDVISIQVLQTVEDSCKKCIKKICKYFQFWGDNVKICEFFDVWEHFLKRSFECFNGWVRHLSRAYEA